MRLVGVTTSGRCERVADVRVVWYGDSVRMWVIVIVTVVVTVTGIDVDNRDFRYRDRSGMVGSVIEVVGTAACTMAWVPGGFVTHKRNREERYSEISTLRTEREYSTQQRRR